MTETNSYQKKNGLPPGSVPADTQRVEESPGAAPGAFKELTMKGTSRDQGALDAPILS